MQYARSLLVAVSALVMTSAAPAAEKDRLKVVIFGGHPDDPESGCGGLVAKLTADGHQVHLAYATCFRGDRKINGRNEADVRRLEAAEACRVLGAKPKFFDYSHEQLVADRATCDAVASWLGSVKPDVVVTHWPLDMHPNHHVASSLVWQCYQRKGGWNLYFFEVLTGNQTLGFRPELYLDLAPVLDRKRAGLDAHVSQGPAEIWAAHEVMHRRRGAECGVERAEAYVLLEAKPGGKMLPVPFLTPAKANGPRSKPPEQSPPNRAPATPAKPPAPPPSARDAPTADKSGSDLHLTYRSTIDGTDQPYRLFVPPQYKPNRSWPLIVALHGTGGNQDTLFDGYGNDGAIKKAAAEHGALLLSPFGRGVTEFKGIGENDIFCAIEDVAKRYRVDTDRVYLTGHSMGGQGTAYLSLHHPDYFAAAAPLSSDCSFPWLGRNATKIPFLWVAGADDHEHYLRGLLLGIDRMFKYGATVKLEVLPGEKHRGPVKDFSRIFAWLLTHKRDPHPRAYAFVAETPLHGRAWWTRVERMAVPGRLAFVRAEAEGKNTVHLHLRNVAEVAFAPDPAVFDLSKAITVTVNGVPVATEVIPAAHELRLFNGPARWRSDVRPSRPVPLTAYRQRPVANAPEALDMLGTEKRLANWITDAMRAATRADLALYSAVYYRGLPIPKGIVDVVDLIQCSRPFDEPLVTVELTGHELLKILDDNLPDARRDQKLQVDLPGASPVIQVSGMRYAFDRNRPKGSRIVQSSLDPERTYRVALEAQAVEYPTFRLAGLFRNLDYTPTATPLTLALYGHAANLGIVTASVEGRVRDVTPPGKAP